ncbi:hyalin-like [Amphiura filiformis]|uniref:hyalin-like n=1 Tax=Amphiura filiformis TaxID=82378 RepID=UPI003B20C91B
MLGLPIIIFGFLLLSTSQYQIVQGQTDCDGAFDFLCANDQCIYDGFMCDRETDCIDNSDEQSCPPATCGGILTATSGVITTPNYPSFYPNDAKCTWIIRGGEGTYIQLMFTNFTLEESVEDGCYDWLEILTTKISDRIGYCGTSLDRETAQSRRNYLWLQFRSDESIVQSGFRAEYAIRAGEYTPPVITGCPTSAIQVTAPTGGNLASASWMEPRATDDSGVTPTRSRSHAPGSDFPVGITTVTYRFSDASGNIATCQFDVVVSPSSVEDTTPPEISGCPDDITVRAPQGRNSRTVTWTEPTATDDSGVEPIRVQTRSPGDTFNEGSTLVAYSFADGAGNIATCAFNIIVTRAVDNIPPVITGCPTSDIQVTTSIGSDTATTIWTEPRATDNSGVTQIRSRSHFPGSNFPVGITTVTYTFSDGSGNIATCQFDVDVSRAVDNIPPVITGCPTSDIQVTTSIGSDTATTIWTEPRATDNSGVTQIRSRSHFPGSNFPVGITTVTYTFSDASGNIATCQFDVDVSRAVDSIPPVITGCPTSDIRVTTSIGSDTATAIWTEPRATDNSGVTQIRSRSHFPGSNFPVGITTVTYTFSDASGNIATCQFDVDVSRAVDSIPPVITGCPTSDIRVTSSTGSNTATAIWTEPRATDNSGVTPTRSSSHAPGSDFPVGITTVTYTFSDASGNIATCQFDVDVSRAVDNIPPVITGCPTSDIQVTTSIGSDTATTIWTEPRATDNSGVTQIRSRSHFPGSNFPVGITTVTYTFSDASGNIATCQFDVDVSQVLFYIFQILTTKISDRIGYCGTSLDRETAQSRRNYLWLQFRSDESIVQSGFRAEYAIRAGEYTPPVITGCPTSAIQVTAPTGGNLASASWMEPRATDDSGVTPTRSRSHAPGSDFPVGITTVTYRFSDASGNIATCQFDVVVSPSSVEDTTPPEISGCPDDRTVTWTEPTATDDSGVEPIRVQTRSPGDTFNEGSTLVAYSFADGAGNIATCAFNIIVTRAVDNIPPVITGCPTSDIQVTTSIGSDTATTIWTEPRATDNSGVTQIRSRSHFPGSNFPVGITTVTYTFSDGSGNIATCQFDVDVSRECCISIAYP